MIELYKVPTYNIIIFSTDAHGKPIKTVYQGVRFMPYWNDPSSPSSNYKTLGWVNSGLSSGRRIEVSQFNPNYTVHNRYSPDNGAFVLVGSFYIHAGPANKNDYGWGSAGCVEIIGDFTKFKQDVVTFSGSNSTNVNDAINSLIKIGGLVVIIESASAPNIKSNLTREE